MAEDIERITAPGKYEIEKAFEEIAYQLQRGYTAPDNNLYSKTKKDNLKFKTKYNGLRTN